MVNHGRIVLFFTESKTPVVLSEETTGGIREDEKLEFTFILKYQKSLG